MSQRTTTPKPTIPVVQIKKDTVPTSHPNDNPMIQPRYYIHESPIWTKCGDNGTNTASRISDISSSFMTTGPITLIEVEQYLSKETSKLLSSIKLAQECDIAGKTMVPEICRFTFKNFSKQQMEGVYVSQFDSTPFNNFVYTDEYIESKTTENDKKMLCQRYVDILQMLSDFSKILNDINEPTITGQYLDQTNKILKVFQQNNVIRKELDRSLTKIYGEQSVSGDSKKFLDSTIYINVLWTILATTLLFYMIRKI